MPKPPRPREIEISPIRPIQPSQIGLTLRRARKAWALSEADLAQRASVSAEALRVAERSGRASLTELASLAGALGGSIDDLLAGREFWKATSIALKTSAASFELAGCALGRRWAAST